MRRWMDSPLVAFPLWLSIVTGGIAGSVWLDQVTDQDAEPTAAHQIASPTPETMARPTPTTELRTTTTRAGPLVALSCPPPDAGQWDWYRAEFQATTSFDRATFSSATMDYGDGRSYTSHSIEDAELNLLWHRYDSPGSYLVRLSVVDSNGEFGIASCLFSWIDTRSSAGGVCDPNYTGCVPIARDVDCAHGSGNGPAYQSGTVQVIGSDIYGLDGDNDGWACE